VAALNCVCVFVRTFLLAVVAASADTEFYGPPMAAAQTDYCKECPGCCGLEIDGPGNTGTQSTATQLIITFTLAALLSCLLLV